MCSCVFLSVGITWDKRIFQIFNRLNNLQHFQDLENCPTDKTTVLSHILCSVGHNIISNLGRFTTWHDDIDLFTTMQYLAFTESLEYISLNI